MMVLSIGEFRENRRWTGGAFLMDGSGITFTCFVKSCDIWNVKTALVKCVLRHRVDRWKAHSIC